MKNLQLLGYDKCYNIIDSMLGLITECKTFLQSSRLAKEVGKPTRCAASCQIARGELSLMHLYNTCIIHIIMT